MSATPVCYIKLVMNQIGLQTHGRPIWIITGMILE